MRHDFSTIPSILPLHFRSATLEACLVWSGLVFAGPLLHFYAPNGKQEGDFINIFIL